jgi:hypothetical protein
MTKFYLVIALGAVFSLGIVLDAPVEGKGQKRSKAPKAVSSMSQDEQIKLAQSAAPAHIAKDATVLVLGEDGQYKEAKQGTNGITCIPTLMNLPKPDPMCMDAAAKQWLDGLATNAPKPSNTVPGIAYMGQGGSHWEKNGRVVMKEEPGAKEVKEPPHWMIMWPFDPNATRLPTVPNSSGAYIMFEESPYAHIMVYQDPRKMK